MAIVDSALTQMEACFGTAAVENELQHALQKLVPHAEKDHYAAAVQILSRSSEAFLQRELLRGELAGRKKYQGLGSFSSGVGTWELDLETYQCRVSPGMAELMGFQPGKTHATSDDWRRAVHPKDMEVMAQKLDACKSPGCKFELEFRICLPGKHERWLYSHGIARQGNSSVVIDGASIDITLREKAKRDLDRQLHLTRAITDNATTALFIMDDRQHCIFMNPAAEKLTGFRFEEVQGRPLHHLIHHTYPDGRHFPIEECPIDRAFPERSQEQGEAVFVHRDGSFYPVSFTASPVHDQEVAVGTVIEVQGTAEKRVAEAALQERKERYRVVLRATNDVIWDWNLITNQIEWNHALTTRFGYSLESVNPDVTWWFDHIHPEDRDRIANGISAVREGGGDDHWEEEYRFRRAGEKDDYAEVLDRGYLIRNKSGRPVRMIGSMLDLSVQKKSAAELKESEARFRLLAEASPTTVWIADARGRVEYFNSHWYRYTGLTEAQVKADPKKSWFSVIHPEEMQCCIDLWSKALKTGEPFEAEVRVRRHDGVYRWLLGRSLPVRNEAGEVIRWVGVNFDIHDQKEAVLALKRSNNDLKQFAWAASHDLQEPLRMVISFTQLLERRYSEKLDHQARQYIQHAVDGARRMEALLAGLREYWQASERGDEPPIRVDLNGIIQQVLGNLRSAITEASARVTWDLLPEVMAQPTPMVQLFQNLISNAIKYRHADRHPHIHIAGQRQGQEWVFTVKDNGIGINPEYHAQIFGIFRRLHTARRYSGTGMGLALCQTIVERYGGTIRVESTPGEGSTFLFTMPVISK